MTCGPGQGIPASIRWVNEISVVDAPLEELKMWDGWTLSPDGTPINDHNGGHGVTSDEESVPYNNPNGAVTRSSSTSDNPLRPPRGTVHHERYF